MNAERYVQWIKARLVNRTDFYMPYEPGQNRHLRNLTDELLLSAAKGEQSLTLFSNGPQGSKCLLIDIDDRRDEHQAENERFAFELLDRMAPLSPLLERSNGSGAFHVWAFFATPQPTHRVAALGRQLVGTRGIETAPYPDRDCFPRLGTVLRIPGPHPIRPVVSALWHDGRWIDWGTDSFLDVLEQYSGVVSPNLPNAQPCGKGPGGFNAMPAAAGITSTCSDWKATQGPIEWAALHKFAWELDHSEDPVWESDHATDALAHLEFANYLTRLISRINCADCRTESAAYVKAHRCLESFFAWTVEWHNAVNRRLGKPELPINEAIRQADSAYKS